jgi:TolB-like protein
MTDLLERLRVALGDAYHIERELGGGGMSRVFVAEEISLGRRVVVKVLPPELAAGVNGERFKREIQLAASLQHPHIVPLLSAGQAGELFWYTMPYFQGDSLRTKLAREGELPVQDTTRILRDVADALAYAHRLGVVHRDIKPDNILISGQHAVVTDFGVAKAISAATGESSLTSAGVALGTPAYMAPEQAAADPHTDHRADIYALGALAYEMLTGRPPFTGLAPQMVLAAQVTEVPEPVSARRPSVPPALASTVMRCLEKKAADRFQTADELHSTLDLLATPSGGMTPTSPYPGTAVRPAAPWRRTAVIAAAVLVVVIALAVGVRWLTHRPKVVAAAARIAILPFSPATPDSALSTIGQNLVVTLSSNLEGVGDIRTVDALTVLAQARDRAYSLAEAAVLARRLGASSFVHGSVVRAGANVRLDVGLFTADSAAPIAQASVSAPPDNLTALTDSLTWALLRQVWRTREAPTPMLASVTTHSVPALRAFLEGERAVVHSRWKAAEEAFGRAIAADSTFWLAYWRYRYARGWRMLAVDSTIRAAYQQHRANLPERDRLLIEGEMSPSDSSSIAIFRTVTLRFPDYQPGWMAYADLLFHWGPVLGYSMKDVRAAFEQTVALNPEFLPAVEHVTLVYGIEQDTAALARGVGDLARLGYDTREDYGYDELLWLRGILQLARTGKAETPLRDSIARSMATGTSQSTLGPWICAVDGIFGYPRSALDMCRRIRREPAAAAVAGRILEVMPMEFAERGGWDSALVSMDRFAEEVPGPASALAAYRLAAVGS